MKKISLFLSQPTWLVGGIRQASKSNLTEIYRRSAKISLKFWPKSLTTLNLRRYDANAVEKEKFFISLPSRAFVFLKNIKIRMKSSVNFGK